MTAAALPAWQLSQATEPASADTNTPQTPDLVPPTDAPAGSSSTPASSSSTTAGSSASEMEMIGADSGQDTSGEEGQ